MFCLSVCLSVCVCVCTSPLAQHAERLIQENVRLDTQHVGDQAHS